MLRPVEEGVTLRVTFLRFELTSVLFSVYSSKFNPIMHMHMQHHATYRSYPFLTKRKGLPNI
jgi:hypothetical protein